MKKKIITTALFFAIGLSAAFAGNSNGTNDAVVASFTKEFSNAKEVKWQKQSQYDMATFKLNGVIMTAYYNDHASLVAVIHHVLTDQLPILLLADLKNNYSDYWVTELYEAATDGESHYHIKLENSHETIKMISLNSTDWMIENRESHD